MSLDLLCELSDKQTIGMKSQELFLWKIQKN